MTQQKEIRSGVTRITLEMPTSLLRRLEAFAEAQAGQFARPNVSLVCRQLLHESLERHGFPEAQAPVKATGKRKAKTRR